MPKIYFKTNDDQIVILNEILVRVYGRLVGDFNPDADYRKCTLTNPYKIDLTIDQLVSFKKFAKFHMIPAKFTREDIKILEEILIQTPRDFMLGQLRQIKLANKFLPLVACTINDTDLAAYKMPPTKPSKLHVKITISENASQFEMNMHLNVAGDYETFFDCLSSDTKIDQESTPFHDVPIDDTAQSGYYSIFYEAQVNIYTINFENRNFITSKISFPASYKAPIQQTIALLYKTLHKFCILGHIGAAAFK